LLRRRQPSRGTSPHFSSPHPYSSRWTAGFGFLTFATKEGAETCLKYHDSEWHGKWLKIQVASDSGPKKSRSEFRAGVKPAGCAELFVGNLAWSVTEDMLWALFEGGGRQVQAVRLAKDKETGQPRGFGFVTLESEAAAEAAAKELNGEPLERRPMRIDFQGNPTVITRDQA